MWAAPLSINPIPHREQPRNLAFPESIAGLDRRFTTHHIEYVGQRGFVIIPINLTLRRAFQKLRQERSRIDPTRDQQRGKSMNRDPTWTGRGCIDTQAFE